MTLSDAVLRRWWSLAESVRQGAHTILSPVWIPIASRFSMLQMIMQLSLWSLMTSYSYSFHPSTLSSIRTWWIREYANPLPQISLSSSSLYAIPPPVPPSVYAGLTRTGYLPMISTASNASSIEVHVLLIGTGSPIFSIVSLNSSLSSDIAIASGCVPRRWTLSLSNVPFSASSEQMFRAVCPPIPAMIPSTPSFSMILAMMSASMGST